MVSVLYKELEYKKEEVKNKKVGGYATEDQIRTSSVVNKNHPGYISPHEVLQTRLIIY